MIGQFKHWIWHPLVDILFPKFCAACDNILHSEEQLLCLSCKYQLPFTEMEKMEENEASLKFYGKLKIERAAALLYFVEEGMVRPMLHKLKYKNQSEIGFYLGKLLAERFAEVAWLDSIDGIVPVPLHYKKQYIRGYNQTDLIADGISSIIKKPVLNKLIKRVKNTVSQTQLSRNDRLANVVDAFSVDKANKHFKNKHILLVDDVLTTGATLESCGQLLKRELQCNISVATIALAHH